MEIIGIAKDGRDHTLYEDQQLYLFLPIYQHPRSGTALLFSTQSAVAVAGVLDSGAAGDAG